VWLFPLGLRFQLKLQFLRFTTTVLSLRQFYFTLVVLLLAIESVVKVNKRIAIRHWFNLSYLNFVRKLRLLDCFILNIEVIFEFCSDYWQHVLNSASLLNHFKNILRFLISVNKLWRALISSIFLDVVDNICVQRFSLQIVLVPLIALLKKVCILAGRGWVWLKINFIFMSSSVHLNRLFVGWSERRII
jgi:hypothetical protein